MQSSDNHNMSAPQGNEHGTTHDTTHDTTNSNSVGKSVRYRTVLDDIEDASSIDLETEETDHSDYCKDNKSVKPLPKDKSPSKIPVSRSSAAGDGNVSERQCNFDYVVDLKIPVHLCYRCANGVKVDSIVCEQPNCNINRAVAMKAPVQAQVTQEEMLLYKKLTLSKDSNHEKRLVMGTYIDIESDRIKFIIKAFTNLHNTSLHATNCIYGLCTLKRIRTVFKTLAVGRKYMFLFRVNDDFTKYITFTIKCKDTKCTALQSGLIQKTCDLTNEDDSHILCTTYHKRSSGTTHQSDTVLNQIEFNCATYIKVTGDMVLMSSTADGTIKYKLNDIFVLTM